MRLVRATNRHVSAMALLMTESPLLRRYGVTPRGARARLAEGLRARDLLLVALGPDVVGFAWVIASRALDRTAYLRLLLVAEGRQSSGIGSELLARAEGLATRQGAPHLALLVTKTNRRARTFYERHGYRHVGDLPGFIRRSIDEALYIKDIVG